MKRMLSLAVALPLALLAACGPATTSGSGPSPTCAPAPSGTTEQWATCAPSASSQPVAALAAADVVPGEVHVYAPGALAAQTDTIAAAYAAARPGATATFEVSHTPTQYEQLKQGSTTDVWIAANPKLMAQAGDEGLVAADAVHPIGRTELVVVTAPGNPGGIQGVEDLAKDGVSVLLAEDKLPIGMTVNTFFTKMDAKQPGWSDRVKANTTSRELGVQPIVTKVGLGEADAGIVFVTDADDKVGTVQIPADVNAALSLEVAPVTAAKAPEAARQFTDYLASPDGLAVLAKAGYLPAA